MWRGGVYALRLTLVEHAEFTSDAADFLFLSLHLVFELQTSWDVAVLDRYQWRNDWVAAASSDGVPHWW